MKILILPVLCTLFGCAHVGNVPDPVSYSNIEWSWIPGHKAQGKWVSGHWLHPENGSYYRAKRHGQPHTNWSPIISYPGPGWSWCPGYWEVKGFHREWIEGRWIEIWNGEK